MLNKVSFKVKEGTFVGICGERGAGKTTLFKLLLRLYDPEAGSITIGGMDVKDYNPVWLRSQIGTVLGLWQGGADHELCHTTLNERNVQVCT
jgi:ABC-type multidrug transport system fused ATPase/permease subunit